MVSKCSSACRVLTVLFSRGGRCQQRLKGEFVLIEIGGLSPQFLNLLNSLIETLLEKHDIW